MIPVMGQCFTDRPKSIATSKSDPNGDRDHGSSDVEGFVKSCTPWLASTKPPQRARVFVLASLAMTCRSAHRIGWTGRWLSLLSLVTALVAMPGCKQEQAAPLPEKPVQLDPLPVPANLIADVYIPNPDVTWAKARLAVGGPAMFLPTTTGALAATFFGLPLTVGSEIDGNIPVVGAVLEGRDGGKPRTAIGLHLRAADNFINVITKGEQARHSTRVDEKTKITIIEPKGGGTGSAALGVLGNYLLAAPTIDDLLDVGPYVVRNLTTAKMPKNEITFDMPHAAIEGAVATTIRSKWENIKPRPRADSAVMSLPSPLQTLVDGVLGVLVEVDRGKITVDFDPQVVHVRFSGAPKSPLAAGSKIAAMSVGDPKKLLDLPGVTDVAVFVQDSAETRTNDAQQYAKSLASAMGKDVTDEDRAAIDKALVALAKSRGDTFAAGLTLLPTGPAAFVRSSVGKQDELQRALDDVFGLVERKTVKGWLGELALEVETNKTVLEDMKGDVRRVHITRVEPKVSGDKPKDKTNAKASDAGKAKKDEAVPAKDGATSTTPKAIDVLYLLGAEDLVLGAGYDAKAALRMAIEASAKDNLSARSDLTTAVSALGGKASFVAVADLMRLLARQAGNATPPVGAPVVFAVGKGGEGAGADEPWMKLDAPNVLIQEAIKRRAAF